MATRISTTSSTTHRQSIAPWSTKATAAGASSKARTAVDERGEGRSATTGKGAAQAGAGSGEGRSISRRVEAAPRQSTIAERHPPAQERQHEGHRETEERKITREVEDDEEGEGADDELGGERHVDLAQITEEYQARRASKSAAEREAFTRSARKPLEDLIDRVEHEFAKNEDHLDALLEPFIKSLESSAVENRAGYLASSHVRGEVEARTITQIERVTDQTLPRIEQNLRKDLATIEDRPAILKRERKRLLGQAQKRVKDELESQKLMADATAILRSYVTMFAHYRPPPALNGQPTTPTSHGGSGKKAGRANGSGGSSRTGKGDRGFSFVAGAH